MRCILLADDCGLSRGVTESILEGVDAGVLSGASIMAGGLWAREAGRAMGLRLKANPALQVGVHLNLLEGRCSSAPEDIPFLADSSGNFYHSLGSLWRKAVLSPIKVRKDMRRQISAEWKAQVAAVREFVAEGFGAAPPPLYVDGHLHVHTVPAVRPALEHVLADFPPARVRVPEELRSLIPSSPGLFIKGTLRRELLAFWGRSLRAFLKEKGWSAPECFVGAFCSGEMTLPRLAAGLAAVARRLEGRPEEAVTEIMLHPGGFSAAERTALAGLPYAAFYLSPARGVEKNMMLSPDLSDLLRRYDPEWKAHPCAPTLSDFEESIL